MRSPIVTPADRRPGLQRDCGGAIEVLLAPSEADDTVWSALEEVLVRDDGGWVGTLGDRELDEAAVEAALAR